MCFALSGMPDLLHQHFASGLFEIISLRLQTHKRFSWISLMTFRVLGQRFSVLHDFLKRCISIVFWLAMIRFRNDELCFP